MAQEMNVGQELLNVPFGEMIQSMAMSIADAQWELDKAAMTVTEMMSGQRLLRDLETGALIDYDGSPLKPAQKDGEGETDEFGDPKYEANNGPRILDTRVYFGYVYEPQLDKDGKVVNTQIDGKDVPQMIRKPNRVSMLELGFTPSFYQFVDTVIEVKMAIKMTSVQSSKVRSKRGYQSKSTVEKKGKEYTWRGSYRWSSGRFSYNGSHTNMKVKRTNAQAYSSSVDATYAKKYGYSVEGSSLLRTKLVPIPPPTMLDERIREVMDLEREYLNLVAGKKVAQVVEPAPTQTAAAAATTAATT